MARHLQLKLSPGIGSTPAPALGETIGVELRKVAEQNESWAEMQPEGYHRDHFLHLAVIFYRLAGDSFEIASGCTIGHKRAERYDLQTKNLRGKADELEKLLEAEKTA